MFMDTDLKIIFKDFFFSPPKIFLSMQITSYFKKNVRSIIISHQYIEENLRVTTFEATVTSARYKKRGIKRFKFEPEDYSKHKTERNALEKTREH